jgi:hypothetical protein
MNRIMPLLLVAAAALAQGQDKPRVFVNGKGTENVATNANSGGNRWFRSGRADSTIGAHDEGMEVTKNLQKECLGVIVTINQATADYTVMLDRESKQNRGLLRTNTQILVANRVGDVLGVKRHSDGGQCFKRCVPTNNVRLERTWTDCCTRPICASACGPASPLTCSICASGSEPTDCASYRHSGSCSRWLPGDFAGRTGSRRQKHRS